jgi:lipopolysaccharide/colanic/teichoic acid biosynthesis glycosyltransferase
MKVQDRLNQEIVAEYVLRHRIKPGMTGWAQVNGQRGAVATDENLHRRIELDLDYIDNWSLWLDFKILLRTVGVCLSQKDAF